MKKVLVIGSNGQLGMCIKAIANKNDNLQFIFTTRDQIDITNFTEISTFFANKNIDFCINCAAYTAVDKAEKEFELAYAINVLGAKYLAQVCNDNNITLIHISTDFVFDGKKTTPYTEEDIPNPINIYGKTKLEGEVEIHNNCNKHFIIRTSWLYSQYGTNFVKTMLHLAETKKEISVVSDQFGTPTNANDLASAIIQIIKTGSQEYGIYHYSNEGQASWYDFSKKIFQFSKKDILLNPIKTEDFITLAERPKYSVLCKEKVKNLLGTSILTWKKSLFGYRL